MRIPLGWSRLASRGRRWPLVMTLIAGVMGGKAAVSSVVAQARAASTPTFSRDIAPVLYRQCSACHRPEGPAPFSVLRYDEVRPWASAILASIEARRMPPWLPEPGVVRFAGERRLTKEELGLIRKWVEGGAPEGDPADLPPPPAFPAGWQLGERGSMLTMRWRYDNTAANPRNPNRPPLRVQYGPRSVDEMGDLVFQVLPRTAEDAEALHRDVRWKYLTDRTEWISRRAYRQGVQLAARGRYAEAVEQFREALLEKPTTDVHVALADALLAQGDTAAAVLHLEQAVRLAYGAGQSALVTELRRRLQRLRH